MNVRDAVVRNMAMGQNIRSDYLKDLTDSDLMLRPVPGMNHLAWQLGHLISSECRIMGQIGAKMPDLPPGFEEKHTKETATSDDPKKFLSKKDYLSTWEKVRAASLAAVNSIDEREYDKPAPEDMREYAPTVGDALLLIGWHELMHVGQFVAVRRKLGKPALY